MNVHDHRSWFMLYGTGRIWFSALLLMGLGGLLCAQTISSTIIGTVVDPTGAVVAKAGILLKNTVTGESRSSTSETSGLFRFPDLLPGTYELTIRAPGFKAYSQSGVEVTASVVSNK